MLGLKSSRPTTRSGSSSSVVKIGGGSISSSSNATKSGSLKKPTAFGSSFTTSINTTATRPKAAAAPCTSPQLSTATNGSNVASAAARQASQSSLLAAGKSSTSRSSLASDTGLSVCSSSLKSEQHQATPSSGKKEQASVIRSKTTSGSTGALITRTTSSLRCGSTKSGSASPFRASQSAATSSRQPSKSSYSPSLSSSSSSSSSATKTSCLTTTRKSVPTVAMSLRDKDQQIKLLIKERDEHKFSAELMARRAEEWEEKFMQSELERSHVTSEADDEVVELRRLAQELEDENKRLAERLSEREQLISDTQFKLDELECERVELKRELDDKEEELANAEREQREISQGKSASQVSSERLQSKAKYEREIEELKEKIIGRDEQIMQLRSSLEMRKNELANLQARASDLERKLKIETERSERHLKRIDEINLELKNAEAKLSTKCEENDMYEKQVFALRQELRTTEEKLEQVSLARKKDVDILHHKLSVARHRNQTGSTTPTSPQPYKTPTPQDEIVRLQMEIRDLKDVLIDREAELDCNRRDMELLRRKMETRTLEVDCNNQELARRCQDLLEQNRQSEETVKQLLKSTTEHSAQLMRATEDLKEANGKCIKLREEINELEGKLEEQLKRSSLLVRENAELKDENEDQREQIELLRRQVDSLSVQLSDLCAQLDVQANNLHKDRESLANQLNQNEIDTAQVKHELATAKQDLRTSRLQTQEVASERDRLKSDLEMKEKYVSSRNNIIETLRLELDDCKRSLGEYRQKLEQLRESTEARSLVNSSASVAAQEAVCRELKSQLDSLKRDCQMREDENSVLRSKCEQLQHKLLASRGSEQSTQEEKDDLEKFEEMRRKHSAELDELRALIANLEAKLKEREPLDQSDCNKQTLQQQSSVSQSGSQVTLCAANGSGSNLSQIQQQNGNHSSKEDTSIYEQQDYETQIEFLNSVVVDMQRKCDEYKNRLAQVETINIMKEFDNIIMSNQAPLSSRSSTLTRKNFTHANKNSPSGYMTLATTKSPDTKTNNTTFRQPVSSTDKKLTYNPARISGRPFCDICRVYDLHHTVYCPKVSEKLSSQTAPLPPPPPPPLNGQTVNKDMDNDITNNNNNYLEGKRNNNNNNNVDGNSIVDDLFREYEESLEDASVRKFSSLRRTATLEKPPRPYCDHCDLFGHTIKTCNALRVV